MRRKLVFISRFGVDLGSGAFFLVLGVFLIVFFRKGSRFGVLYLGLVSSVLRFF